MASLSSTEKIAVEIVLRRLSSATFYWLSRALSTNFFLWYIRLPAVPLSGSNLVQVVHTCVPLSPSGQGVVMPCSWEGNRRSGVALAMRHRLQWFIHLRAHGLDREMSTPPTLSCGVWPIYIYLTVFVDRLTFQRYLSPPFILMFGSMH